MQPSLMPYQSPMHLLPCHPGLVPLQKNSPCNPIVAPQKATICKECNPVITELCPCSTYVPNSYEQLKHAVRPTDQGFPAAIHDTVRKGLGARSASKFLFCLLSVLGAGTAIDLQLR